MALAGEGAICIWNDILPECRAGFYAWHNEEHMPERVGIPGFKRGRRYIAVDDATRPEYFTLYETESYEVLVGQDYANRLNAPTPRTKTTTASFRNTSRALTRVHASHGLGSGGILATIRFGCASATGPTLARAMAADPIPALVAQPQIIGVHLCMTDASASAVPTAESKDRSDIQAAPDGVVLIEGCSAGLVKAASDTAIRHVVACGALSPIVGLYRLEYARLKNAHACG
jgi:hypothetical protein